MSVSHATVRRDRNPALLPGVVAVMAWLLEQNYSQVMREAIGRHAHVHGELAGAVDAGYLDPEDEAAATEVFTEALPDVPADSPAWDDEDVLIDVELLLAGVHPLPFGDGPDAPDDGPHVRFPGAVTLADRLAAAAALEDLELAPISGGSPAYEPTAEDLADYHAWSEDLDRRRGLPTADQCERVATALYGPNRYS